MTPEEIQAEADYRWIERAAIFADDRQLTDLERKLVNEEITAFETTEKQRTHANERRT